jgi:hypothetical protein
MLSMTYNLVFPDHLVQPNCVKHDSDNSVSETCQLLVRFEHHGNCSTTVFYFWEICNWDTPRIWLGPANTVWNTFWIP